MDLLSLEGKNALHIIDRDTLLSAAVMLSHGDIRSNLESILANMGFALRRILRNHPHRSRCAIHFRMLEYPLGNGWNQARLVGSRKSQLD